MANYATLKASIQSVIKQNGNNEITGAILQQTLISIINSLGVGYEYIGVATPSTNPGTPDQNVFYIASTAGTYSNFNSITLKENEIAILAYDGSWHKHSTGAAAAAAVTKLSQDLPLNLTSRGFVSSWAGGSGYDGVTNNYVTLEQGHKYRVAITFGTAGTLAASANLKLMSSSSYSSVKMIIGLNNRTVSAGEIISTDIDWTDPTVVNYRLGFYDPTAAGRTVLNNAEVSIKDITLDSLSNAVLYQTQKKTIEEKGRARFNLGAQSAETIRNSIDYCISHYTSTLAANINNSTGVIESASARFLSFRKVQKGEVYAIIAHNPLATSNWFVLWMTDSRPAIGHTDTTMQVAREMGSTGVFDFVIEWEAPKDGWLVVAAQRSANSYYTIYEKVGFRNIFNYASQKISIPIISTGKAVDADPDSANFGQPITIASTYFGISDFIDITGCYCISVGVIYNTSNIFLGTSLGGVFYDADRNPIAPFNVCNFSPSNTSGRRMVLVPSNAKYIRTTTWTNVVYYLFKKEMSEVVADASQAKPIFSSYIPFRESYENYMTVQEAQGATIYGDYVFAWHTGNVLNVYDMVSKTRVQQVTLPTFPNTRTHANTISFGKQKYDSGDTLPLLYLCSGYTTAAGDPNSQVYVIRLAGAVGSLVASLVQTITLSFGEWTEWVVDPIKDVAWINGSGIATYICVAVPSVAAGNVTMDASVSVIDKFDTPAFVLGLSTASSGQGRYFYHSRVFYVSGVPQYAGQGEDSLYLVVDNTLTHCRESVVALKNFGLANGSDITYEPEACFVWNNDFFVVYRTFIAKLIQ